MLAICALWLHSFWTFCAAFGLIGVYKAFAQYYRFAAAEAVHGDSFADTSNAVAVVLVGSFVAAVSGPWIAARVRNLVPALPYAGSFLAIALMGTATLALVAALRFPAATNRTSTTGTRHGLKPSALLRRRGVAVAIVSATIGYTVMAVMMVTAPLAAMGYGASVSTAALIMQFHVAGMYAPSLFIGKIIGRYGTRPVIFTGCLLQLFATLIAFSSASVPAFVAALLLCGVGWNCMYVGSTVLLTNSCSHDERATVQGANEFIMFSIVTVASFGAATALSRYGWHGVQLSLAMPLLVCAVAAVGVRTDIRTPDRTIP
jgi:predicted MFS family arabinose efflux permease